MSQVTAQRSRTSCSDMRPEKMIDPYNIGVNISVFLARKISTTHIVHWGFNSSRIDNYCFSVPYGVRYLVIPPLRNLPSSLLFPSPRSNQIIISIPRGVQTTSGMMISNKIERYCSVGSTHC